MKLIIALFSLTMLMPLMSVAAPAHDQAVPADCGGDGNFCIQDTDGDDKFYAQDTDGDGELNLDGQAANNFYYGYPMYRRAFMYPFMYSHYALPYRGLYSYGNYGLYGGLGRLGFRFPYYRSYYLNYLYPTVGYSYTLPVTQTVVKINKAEANKE